MKVSVLMITYNHEKFITQAIDSILMQEVNFDYEIVIGEDCSTDNTRNIVIDYQKKYPDKIRLLLPETNLGMQKNLLQTLQACQGEYIALIEGDDYWIDQQKLQKQTDFLDKNSGYAICFGNAYNYREKEETKQDYLREVFGVDLKDTYVLEDLLYDNFIPTASSLFRKEAFHYKIEEFLSCPFSDWFLWISILKNQHKAKCINEFLSVRRVHSGGVIQQLIRNRSTFLNTRIKIYTHLDLLLEYKYHKVFNRFIEQHQLELKNQNKNITLLKLFKVKENRLKAKLKLFLTQYFFKKTGCK